MYTLEERQLRATRIAELLPTGLTLEEIGREVGFSRSYVGKVVSQQWFREKYAKEVESRERTYRFGTNLQRSDNTGIIPIDDTATDECDCQFSPYRPGDYNPGEDPNDSWHYLRRCRQCDNTWYSLHCPHDAAQNGCPKCGAKTRRQRH